MVYRHGTLQLPVDIQLGFEDGTKQVRHWDGSGFTFNVDNLGPSQLVSVNVDPEQRILLDDDRSNNWLDTRARSAPLCRERALYAAQLLLELSGRERQRTESARPAVDRSSGQHAALDFAHAARPTDQLPNLAGDPGKLDDQRSRS